MRRTRAVLTVASAVSLALLTLSACGADETENQAGKGNKENVESGRKTGESSVTVTVVDSEFGEILGDGSGRTLYGFTKDKPGTSNCGADCIAVWPALTSSSPAEAGEGAEKSLLRRAERTKGVGQIAYGDWPLYYYAGDVLPGDVNGQGLDGEWFVVTADGKLVGTGSA